MQNSLVVPMVTNNSPFTLLSGTRRLVRVVSVAAVAVMLTACATTAPVVSTEPAINKSPGVHDMIVQSAARVDAMRARMQASKKPADFTGPRMDVFWVGDAREILRQIAAQRKLQFVETGPKPYLDLPVDVALYNVTLEEALKDIDGQNRKKADVHHYDNKIVLEMKLY